MAKKGKIFILDTNVPLHDHRCLMSFGKHDIIIPMTVIEELDFFKKGNQDKNYHARKFTNAMDAFSHKDLFSGQGAKISENHGSVSVVFCDENMHEKCSSFLNKDNTADMRILSTVCKVQDAHPDKEIIFVCKDVNLRLKARSVGVVVEDYVPDSDVDIDVLQIPQRMIEGIDGKVINQLHSEGSINTEDIGSDVFKKNTGIVLRNGQQSALAFVGTDNRCCVIKKENLASYGITPRNAEQAFAMHALQLGDIKLVSLSGRAGTGKTLLALAAGLQQRGEYRQIILTRPIVPLSNKDIGFLPGDVDSKTRPYMQPLFDNLGVIRTQFPEKSEMYQRLVKMLEDDKLTIEPLAYIRGRSLVKMYVIVDEAQNLTPHEVKTIVTRAGDGTKIAFTGDIEQIDHPYLNKRTNGLSYLIGKMSGQSLYGHVTLIKGERSELSELASNIL